MKKRLKIVFLPVFALCLIAVLFACKKPTYTVNFDSNEGSLVASIENIAEGAVVTLPEAPTKDGYVFSGWYLDNETFSDEFTANTRVTANITVYAKWTEEAHVHDLVHHAALAATCTEAGTIEYWSCSSCGKNFSDANGTVEVTNLVVPALGHTLVHHAALAATCTEAGTIEYWSCSICGEKFSDANATTEITDIVVPALGHDYVFTRTVAPDPINKVDGYDLYTCSRDETHTEQRNIVEWETLVHSVTFVLNDGTLESDLVEYIEGTEVELPIPAREGYYFLGWFTSEEFQGEPVTVISVEDNTDLEFYALWRDVSLGLEKVYVGSSRELKTLADGLEIVSENGAIYLDNGTYEGAKIEKLGVSIFGPNKDIYPTATNRGAEAIFTTDITIAANSVTINGIELTGNGRIIGGTAGVENLVVTNVYVYKSTINPTSAQSTVAPMQFYSNVAGIEYKNLVLSNLVYEGSTGRPMILYGAQINGLSITNSLFTGSYTNYNDGIKIASNANFGIKGDVSIIGNQFKGYQQYVIWFARFAEGNYVIENNTFENCGITAGSHAAVTFNIYNGGVTEDSKVKISFTYNTVIKSFMLFRLDNTAALVESMLTVNVNYNKLYNSTAVHYIKNGLSYAIDGTNNYYDVTPIADKFLGTTWQPFYENVSDIPAYEGATYLHELVFDLDGGEFTSAFPKQYNSNTGLSVFPAPTKENYIFIGWNIGETPCEMIPAGTTGTVTLKAVWEELGTTEYTIDYVFDSGGWVTRPAESRTEVVEALFTDYYNWAVKYNGYSGTYEAFCKGSDGTYASGYWYTQINGKMRNASSKLVDESGANDYFWNTPEYYYKWAPFFAEFDIAMKAVNSAQSFYTDTYAAMIRMYQFCDWTSTGQGYFNSFLSTFYSVTKVSQTPATSYYSGAETVLIDLVDESGRIFLGWYDNPEFNGSKITKIPATSFGNKTFYAKWAEVVLADEIVVSNEIDEIERFETYQLAWNFSPMNTTDQRVELSSSDPDILKVSASGLLTALKNGTATITIKAIGGSKMTKEIVINVYSPAHFELSYDTVSYVITGSTIDLLASFFRKNGTLGTIAWTSLTPEIASVDANGRVTGLAVGTAVIRVTADDDDELYKDFVVTVITEEMSDAVKEILSAHQSNVLVKYDFGVGAGVPVYYTDMYGSVSNLLFEDFVINDKYLAAGNANTANHGGEMTSIEFITVHYTGNMNVGSNAAGNASYFVGATDVSIHYTVGNDGAFHCLDDKYNAWHAGDSASSNYVGLFEWLPTGVDYSGSDLISDLLSIAVTASNDAYYMINGVKTTIKIPATYDYNSRGLAHTFNNDGTITTNMHSATNRTAEIEEFFTPSGFRFKVEDGKYYMAKTWWCYTQVYEGRICSVGGNRNSVGIESCVDRGSDLWYTSQKLAQLVAQLLVDHNLDITRVVMHNFFSAKDCHQVLLANNLELWHVFIDMVKHEYNLLKNFSGYEFALTSDNQLVGSNGRVTKSEDAEILKYTITVTNEHGVTEEITLASAVNGIYSK